MAKERKRENPPPPRGQDHNIPASQGARIERRGMHTGEQREAAATIPGQSGAERPSADESGAAASARTGASSPDPDRIARRAYELYEARGGSAGAALDDWLTAEQELNSPDERRGRG